MKKMNRRRFLSRSAKTAISLSGGTVVLAKAGPSRADAANDKIVMGVIGLGGRGQNLGGGFARREDVEVAYVCDVDDNRGGDFPDEIERIQGKKPKRVRDMRRIFDDKDVDAVFVATPDHWHAVATVWACQAGKDVYVEKPPSHNVWEGRKMVEAARKYKRVVQAGTQNRSAPYVHAALEYIQSGKLGDVPLAKVYNLKGGEPHREPEDSEVPAGVDYDLYLGPAPKRRFNRAHFHDGWKKYWAYSGGDVADDGIHQLDIARLLIGDKPYPKAINCSGGNLAWDDDREVPDTQVVSYEYDDLVMTFELTQFATYMSKTPGHIRDGDLFPYWQQDATRVNIYGTKELMYMGRHGGGWQVLTSDGKVVAQEYGRQVADLHQANFIDCIRSRDLPNADIETAHRSAILVHLGNLGVRLGGRRLVFDAETESIVGDAEASANGLVRRAYRDPYVVPEKV